MKRSELILLILQVPVDLCMLILAGVTAYYTRFTRWALELKPVLFALTFSEFFYIIVWVSLGWLAIFALAGLYSTDPNRKLTRDLNRVVLAASAGLSAVAVYVLFMQEQFDSRFLVAAGWFFAILYVSLGRVAVRGFKGVLYRAGVGLRRVAVVGNEETARLIVDNLRRRPELGYNVVGQLPGFNRDMAAELDDLRIDEMIFTNPRAREDEALAALDYCNDRQAVFKYSADLFATYSANTAGRHPHSRT